jgi:hypothetical protein
MGRATGREPTEIAVVPVAGGIAGGAGQWPGRGRNI